jgi:mRNA interferase YafQ
MKISRHKQFKKDFAKHIKTMQDKHFQSLINAISLLLNNKPLSPNYKDHQLQGKLSKFREFHIGGDLLVMYAIENDVLYLLRIGTHSEIFEKF